MAKDEEKTQKLHIEATFSDVSKEHGKGATQVAMNVQVEGNPHLLSHAISEAIKQNPKLKMILVGALAMSIVDR